MAAAENVAAWLAAIEGSVPDTTVVFGYRGVDMTIDDMRQVFAERAQYDREADDHAERADAAETRAAAVEQENDELREQLTELEQKIARATAILDV